MDGNRWPECREDTAIGDRVIRAEDAIGGLIEEALLVRQATTCCKTEKYLNVGEMFFLNCFLSEHQMTQLRSRRDGKGTFFRK